MAQSSIFLAHICQNSVALETTLCQSHGPTPQEALDARSISCEYFLLSVSDSFFLNMCMASLLIVSLLDTQCCHSLSYLSIASW